MLLTPYNLTNKITINFKKSLPPRVLKMDFTNEKTYMDFYLFILFLINEANETVEACIRPQGQNKIS